MNLLDLLDEEGIEAHRVASTGGGEYASPCPWCGGEDRFLVWPNEQPEKGGRFWCRGCERKGDAIDYLRQRRGLTFRAACKELGFHPRWKSPRLSRPPSLSTRGVSSLVAKPSCCPSGTWVVRATEFLRECVEELFAPTGYAKRRYLIEERGLTIETVRRFRLGLHFSHRREALDAWGLPAHAESESLYLPPGLLIPLLGRDGVLRLRIRTNRPDHRYHVVPGSSLGPMLLFTVPARPLVLVESELDALLMWQAVGDLVNVAALGFAQASPDHQLDQLVRSTPLLLCLLDYDDAGETAATKWRETYPAVFRRPQLPAGKDPGEAWQAGVELRSWLVGSLPPRLIK